MSANRRTRTRPPRAATSGRQSALSDPEAPNVQAAPPAQETLRFNFPKFLDALFSKGVLRVDLITALRQLLDVTFPRDSPPLPAHAARLVDVARRQLEYMEALASGRDYPPLNTPGLFDSRVRWLLRLNYWHAVENAGRDAAKAELFAIAKELTRGAKGRPTKISVDQIQAAKQQWEDGLSFGEIARKLWLGDARRVRTALKHNYPDRFREKKSAS